MKTLKTIIVAVVCFAALGASAQTADEIVAKYVAAMGGADKLNSINSLQMEGTVSVQGMDIPVTLTTLNKKGNRMDIDVMGQTGYRISNTSKGWRFFPFQGDTDPVEMSEEEYKAGKDQLDLTDKLLHAKELGNKVEYVGKEDVDGAPAYKLKITRPSGEVTYTFIDEKTSFAVRKVSKTSMGGNEMETISTFKDFKKNAEGFWFPYTIDSNVQGTVNFSKITVNGPVDEKMFNQ
jgi:hypothetical protein